MFLDYIAAAFALFGVYLVGQKNKYGFIVCMLSGLCWCFVAIFTGVYGLFLEVLPLFALNLYNFYKWKKEEAELEVVSLERIEGLLRGAALPYLENNQVHDATRCVEAALKYIQEMRNDI